ncbi:MAG: hypothetical protein IJ538_01415 [Clostridia bacterium]|nr:hypothetical protein [Clostridia bacterium]
MNFESLIGLEVQKAKQILSENGYNEVSITINSKEIAGANSTIVCAVREKNNQIELVCGKFITELGI